MFVERRRWLALAAVSLSVLAVGIDGTVLSIALPTLAGALHASESQLEWFSSGYLLMLAAAVLPVGLLGDRFGRKKVLLVSLLVFGVGSALCAYSTSPEEFLIARLLMGLAGAGIAVMALTAVTVFFDEATRPKAVGVFAAANFLSLPLGPIVGGWMLANLWWGWVFLLNVPVVAVGMLAVALLIPESRATERPGIDVVGMLSSVAGLVVFTYGIIEAGQNGWSDAAALACLAIGAAVLAGFVFWEIALTRRGGSPLVDTRLFRSRAFAGGAILAGVAGMGMVGMLFVMPQFFQAVQGVDVFVSGLRLLPFVGGMLVGALPAGRISSAIGFKATVTIGFVVIAIGSVLGSFTVGSTGEVYIAIWMGIVCAGAGLALTAAMSAAVSQLTAERSGVGSGVVQALQKTSAPLGTAILGSIVAAAYSAQLMRSLSELPVLAAHQSVVAEVKSSVYAGVTLAARLHSSELANAVRTAFTHGMTVSLLVSAAIAAVGAIMAVVILPGPRPAETGTPSATTTKRGATHAESNR
ncbi:MFS transporter [Humibacter ginsenosidimutans]|uniref:MFS transporter n=1 Tax=Humibacter ginsenosidimutans TaxID=2599293 RepID=A0A5B8M5E1_9MICO|nr:MFS transporter [Humibacter ginsenosidimutans]QDZ14802.1 MFS transporter [Humibacter ginsenosidimutans]